MYFIDEDVTELYPLLSPILVLFAVITLGLALGKVKVGGVSLDNAGVVFVGLAFGHFGFVIPEIFQTLGLVFFVFSVGMQSGPGFLGSFNRGGLKYLGAAAFMIVVSVATMAALAWAFGLDPRLALGLLTGGRSSNSALAVGVASTASNLPAVGHSLAYPLAVLAILLFVRALPFVFRADLKAEEAAVLALQRQENPPLVTRTYRVDNPNVFDKTLSELHFNRLTGVNISRVMQDQQIHVPGPDFVLRRGDLVKAVGQEKDQINAALLLGPEAAHDAFVDLAPDQDNEARWVVVTAKSVVNQPLNRLGLRESFGATVTRLQRNGIEISPHGTTVLRYADRVMVVVGRSSLKPLTDFLGDPKRTADKDFLPLFLIVLLGLGLGAIAVPLSPGFTFSLGTTGGVLVASLVLSAVGRTGPLLWAVSESSNRFVRQLGLLLFLGAVGTNAGTHIVDTIVHQGGALVVTALAIAVVPLALMAVLCRFVWKMDILTILGLVSGATTCSPALAVAGSLTTTNIPNVAYASVYPFAMLFMMVCAQVVALLF